MQTFSTLTLYFRLNVVKNVFLVKTPLQLLNAVEAKYYFKLLLEDCVLIVLGDRKSQSQLLSLADNMHEWGLIIVLNDVGLFFGNPLNKKETIVCKKTWFSKLLYKSVFNLPRINRISKSLGNVNDIYIGYYNSVFMRHFANITPHNRVVLLDDGAVTIKLAKDRREKHTVKLDVSTKNKVKYFFKKYIQGLDAKEINSLCFFTTYDISVDKSDSVIKNNFSHIKSNIKASHIKDVIYFLGSPLDEAGIIDQKLYMNHLVRVRRYFKESDFVYIAHRRESKYRLDEISKVLNVEVVLFDYPIEYQLAIIGPRPKVISSFVSSALDNCRDIFGSEIKIIAFRLDLTTSPRKKDFELIYENYKLYENEHFFVENIY